MAKEPIITNERVDDIPLLLTQLEHMGVEQLIDKHFPSRKRERKTCWFFMLAIRSEKLHDPTTEIILAAFKEITLLLIEVKNEIYAHLTALSPLQKRILALLGFPLSIYTQLDGQSFTPE